ncbi:uncharacterized protein LOC109822525 [Asparagus officinalis]|uniref:uncharacterized protein LOC109822525 n=1 Tax=Asparagus officinalis TaxID=4686 RepID=UPI00098E14A1|nr:uncharacterized protein LOC109822525 [Asparagus officinalis]
MRSKEPELYRNGYTQRIRAFEHNVLAGKVPNEQNDSQQLDSVNEYNPSGKLERPHTIDYIHTVKTMAQQAKNSSKSERHAQPSSNCENGHPAKIFHNQSLRKPRTRYIYVKPTDCATSGNQDARCHQQSGFEGSKTKSGSILTTKSITEEPAHKLLKSHSAPTVSTICEGEDDKRFSPNSVSCKEIPGLLSYDNRSLTNQIDMKQNLNCQNEIPQNFSCNMETSERENSIKGLMLLSTAEMKDDIQLGETKQNEEVRPLQIDDSKLTSSDQNIAENLDVLKDDPVIQSNCKVEATCESSEALPQVGKDKFLKYTFQRTRKRGASTSKNESASLFPEKVTGKRKSTDKENVSLEPHKPPSVTELPRNNRRLMQVARQLISLSEKRW